MSRTNQIYFDHPGDFGLWEQTCLPIGNGYMGASMFGGIEQERVVLNEKTFWAGGPCAARPDYYGGNHRGRYTYVKQVQKLLAAGEKARAEELLPMLTGDGDFGSYRISEAFMLLYKLFWDDFSGWYLEMIKPAYGAPVDPRTVDEAKGFFDALLRLLHPFMPFVTEEIWQDLAPRAAGESIMVARQPQADGQADEALLARFELVKETITAVRNIRKQKNLPQREALTLEVIADANYPADYAPVLTKMANLSAIERVAEKDAAAAAFIVKTTQYFVPLGDRIDREAEIAKLGEELTYYEGFLQSVERKLSNERFVQSAPAAVVEKERAKKADAEAKIAAIREQLAALN